MSLISLVARADVAASEWDDLIRLESGNLNFNEKFLSYRMITDSLSDYSMAVYFKNMMVGALVLLSNELREFQPAKILLSQKLPTPIAIHIYKLCETYCETVGCNSAIVEMDKWHGTPLLISDNQFPTTAINLLMNLNTIREFGMKKISRNHKRTISRSLSLGQKTTVIDSETSASSANLFFESYKETHCIAAGRQTRNNESFDYMRQLIQEKKAILFVATTSNIVESFLFCDFDSYSARGWSQANVAKLPENHFPRTKLEWDAINHFSSMGLSKYHLGLHHFGSRSNKNASILEFKMRFHPELFSSNEKIGYN